MRLPDLLPGRLVRRYQRFFADVALDDGRQVTAHCANTGSMRGCAEPGSRVWLSPTQKPGRKLNWTWELVETAGGSLVGVVPLRANALVREALEAGQIPALAAYTAFRPEVRYGAGSRVDWLLQGPGLPPCHLEVKSVTLVADGIARFPDAVTRRGSRHLDALQQVVAEGGRAAMLFCVQRGDANAVQPADDIDPDYGQALRRALANGVEAWALGCAVTPQAIRAGHLLPVVCP